LIILLLGLGLNTTVFIQMLRWPALNFYLPLESLGLLIVIFIIILSNWNEAVALECLR